MDSNNVIKLLPSQSFEKMFVFLFQKKLYDFFGGISIKFSVIFRKSGEIPQHFSGMKKKNKIIVRIEATLAGL